MQLFVKDKEFYKKAALIAIPITGQSMITIGINLMDTIMLGSFGETQLSASSLANQFYSLFQILCMGMGFGAAVITAQFWGRKELEPLRQVITIMLRICIGISLIFTVVSLLFPAQIMRIYTPNDDIVGQGVRYFRFLSYTYLFQGLALTITIILRSVRVVRVSLFSSFCAFFINIFFNWVFIFGKLGAPRLEIEGAAIGTLIARIFEACFIVGYFLLFDKKIGYSVKDFFGKCGNLVSRYIKYSIPVLVSDSLLAIGNNAVAIVMGHIGAAFVSGNAITAVTVQISTVFIQGISNASSVMTGNTLGEGDKERAYREGVTFFSMSALVGLMAGGFIILLSPYIINFYNITSETKEIAGQLMKAVGVIVVFQSVGSVMTKGVLRGGGDTKFLMVADILFLWVASIPLGYFAGLVLHLPVFWIYFFLKIDHVLKSVWCIKRLISKKWLKSV